MAGHYGIFWRYLKHAFLFSSWVLIRPCYHSTGNLCGALYPYRSGPGMAVDYYFSTAAGFADLFLRRVIYKKPVEENAKQPGICDQPTGVHSET